MVTQTRASKQLGDFGEGLVTYALIRKGFEVAYVDHVGADLIAEKSGNRHAVSVKTRLFRDGSKESRVVVVEDDHIKRLEGFSKQFGMIPVFAQVICIADEKVIHLFMMSVSKIRNVLPRTAHGYSLRFGKKRSDILIENNDVDYSCWKDERIGSKDFP